MMAVHLFPVSSIFQKVLIEKPMLSEVELFFTVFYSIFVINYLIVLFIVSEFD